MNIGILSDTHDQGEAIEQAVAFLNKEQVKLVFHCGDWISPYTLRFYKKLACPIKGVFGNNDGDRIYHRIFAKKIRLPVEYEEELLDVVVHGRHIAVYHGDSENITDALISCGKYDAVFHGHTHRKLSANIGKTLSFNPGTLVSVTDRSIRGKSFGVYNTKTNTAKIITL